jgi:hypothetical protein
LEEKIYHGDARRKLNDTIEDNMLGGDYSLKAKIERERILFNEKSRSKERN